MRPCKRVSDAGGCGRTFEDDGRCRAGGVHEHPRLLLPAHPDAERLAGLALAVAVAAELELVLVLVSEYLPQQRHRLALV